MVKKKDEGLLGRLGDVLRATGAKAEQLAKAAAAKAEQEKVRLDLYGAHAGLGEALMKVWAANPAAPPALDAPEFATWVKRIREREKRLAELERRIADIRAGKE
jgi:hypothetical protein